MRDSQTKGILTMASQPLPHFEPLWPANQEFVAPDGVPCSASDPRVELGVVAQPGIANIPISVLDEIARMTSELFAGDVRIETSVDPEYPQRPNFVFHVSQKSRSPDVEEEIDRELDWHARISGLALGFRDRLRLFLS